MSASTMMPVMFAVSAFFIPIGIGLITTSEKIKEKVIEYSDHPNCQHCKSGPLLLPGNCTCRIDVKVETKWAGDVYFLYGMSNFYQNHYRYINSRDNQQLRGKLNNETVAKSCKGYVACLPLLSYAIKSCQNREKWYSLKIIREATVQRKRI